MIKINNYTKDFSQGKGIFNINLNLEPGLVYGLIGPNGAGKTTLITALEGMYKSNGEITIKNNSESCDFMVDVSSMLGVNDLMIKNIKEISKIYSSFCSDFNNEKFYNLLDKFGIKNHRQSIRNLSKGEHLALRIALALSRDTSIYLFDEPLSGIDILKRDVILESIFEVMDDDKTVVISSHELHDIDKRIDELIFLNEGKVILQNSLDDMKDEHQLSLVDFYKKILRN